MHYEKFSQDNGERMEIDGLSKEGFEKEEKYKELIREFCEEVYDWSIPEIEEFEKDWISQLEELKMPHSVIVWCKKLIMAICEVKKEKFKKE